MPEFLIIARHSYAYDSQPGQADRDRKLSPEGLAEARKTGEWLKGAGILPDVILASPSERTTQTASEYSKKITGFADGFQTAPFLYLASAHDIADYLKENFEKEQTILIVGHNPAVSNLAETLSGHSIGSLSPAGAAIFKVNLNSWTDFHFQAASLSACRNASAC